MAVYLSGVASGSVRSAQQDLDAHVDDSASGRCLRCDQDGPCPTRAAALGLLNRYGLLPVRRPGATRPALIGRALAAAGSSGPWFRTTPRPRT